MYIYIFILACVGFAVSLYIWRKKKKNQKLVCVIGDDCDKVVRSKYSAFLGVQNEVLGMVYYAFVAFFALIILSGVSLTSGVSLSLVFSAISGPAALFSLTLVFIQIFVIREWCEYCLVSAFVSIAIFILHLI